MATDLEIIIYDTEFKNYLNNLGLNQKTVNGIHFKYIKYMNEFTIIDPENVIFNVIESGFYDKVSYQYQTIGMLVHYYRYIGLDYTQLIEENKKLGELMKSNTLIKNKQLKETLPNCKELLNFNLQNFKKKKYREYVVNYLLINFCVRLMDLDVNISRDTKKIDKDKNYLIIRKTSVIYYRNKFKTVGTYGPKKHIIKSKKIIECLNNLLGENNEVKLLITHINLNAEIKKYTYNNMTESQIFKCVICYKQQKSKNPLNEISRLSKLRGSSVDTIISNYNIQL